MAVIRGFQGVRYNQSKVGNLDSVVTPPYDVISPEDQRYYYDKHPNNVVRLILPRETGDGSDSKYESSAACLNEWLDSGVLIQDEVPCIYACEQEYKLDGQTKRRLGFTCLVRLEDFDRKTVLPHENILSKPLEDRLSLMRATQANFDSVFGLYSDGKIESIMRPFLEQAPDASATDKDGVRCNVWRIPDPKAVKAIADALASESILIADGHHRYTAALAFRDEMRTVEGGCSPDAPYEYVLMTLVSLQDKGLVVLPTHRLVKSIAGFDASAFVEKLSDKFVLQETPADRLMETVQSMDSGKHVFGVYLGSGRSYAARLKPTVSLEREITTPGSDALKRLDVSVLHSLILEKLLGIGVQQLAAASNISYTRDIPAGMKSVGDGENQILFLMNPTKVDEVKAVSSAGDRMPQKSTFFYPKLLTGMVMRTMVDSA